MYIANIFPVLNTYKIYEQDYSMALTHLVLKYPAYAKCFKKYKGYKMLDNSIIELGDSLSLDKLIEAAVLIDADEIILPDVLKDTEATLKLVDQSIQKIKKMVLDHKITKPFKLMAVCQGKTERDIYNCFAKLDENPDIDVIGIPKHITSILPEGRPGFERMWQHANKQIHLLGLAHSFVELRSYRYPEHIRSCDTCLHSYLAKNHLGIFNIRESGKTFDLENEFITDKEYEECLRR